MLTVMKMSKGKKPPTDEKISGGPPEEEGEKTTGSAYTDPVKLRPEFKEKLEYVARKHKYKALGKFVEDRMKEAIIREYKKLILEEAAGFEEEG